jgi:hypothetical protein
MKKPERINARQHRFIEAYCFNPETRLDHIRSYMLVYDVKDRTKASIAASQLMHRPIIMQAIADKLRTIQSQIDVQDVYLVVNTLHTMSFYDPFAIVDEEGTLRSKEEIGNLSCVIKGISTYKDKQGNIVTSIKLVDRLKALELYARYLDIVKPRNDVSIDIKIPGIYITGKDSTEPVVEV